MSKKSNNQGRAYEYACLTIVSEAIKKYSPVEMVYNSSYEAAKRAWGTLNKQEQALYLLSARSILKTIFAMEPNMEEITDAPIQLYIQADRHGIEADVRDIIIRRDSSSWEIGLSIKHNHTAVKHSRLSRNRDFGLAWYGVSCSELYWTEVKPVFDYLESLQREEKYFRELPDKEGVVYETILQAFKEEIKRAIDLDKRVPQKLVAYLLSNDKIAVFRVNNGHSLYNKYINNPLFYR